MCEENCELAACVADIEELSSKNRCFPCFLDLEDGLNGTSSVKMKGLLRVLVDFEGLVPRI
jgi:hypothetical protein